MIISTIVFFRTDAPPQTYIFAKLYRGYYKKEPIYAIRVNLNKENKM
jgi:hypothetical protein